MVMSKIIRKVKSKLVDNQEPDNFRNIPFLNSRITFEINNIFKKHGFSAAIHIIN